MALKLLQAGIQPIGQFDGYDADYLTIKGGEIGRLFAVPYVYPQTSTSDKAAADVYQGTSNNGANRVCVSHTLTATSGTYRPLFLLDEGTVGYGTMFGTLVGGVVGNVVPNPGNLTGATVLGPSTAYGSGKVTCWDKPGLYAVTLDAVASSVVTSAAVNPGDAIYANTNGQLSLTSGEAFDTSGTPTIVGRFVEFSSNGSFVTTPTMFVDGTRQLTQMVFHFAIEN